MTRSGVFNTLAEAMTWAANVIGDSLSFTVRCERTRDGKRRVTVTTGAAE
jgi:hypothetical protein